MRTISKEDFTEITKDILNTREFNLLDEEMHHGLSRYGHSLRVAKATYKVTKLLNLDYVSATRAALLHDFFYNEDIKGQNLFSRLKNHPNIACKRACKTYDLTKKEINIIESHMFPMCCNFPKHCESWLVSLIDKSVAIYELYRFKLNTAVSIWLIFVFNMITIQK